MESDDKTTNDETSYQNGSSTHDQSFDSRAFQLTYELHLHTQLHLQLQYASSQLLMDSNLYQTYTKHSAIADKMRKSTCI